MSNTSTEPPAHGSGHTHAKVILLGEHSVVYGKPAIGYPVHSLKLVATADLTGEGWCVETPFHRGTIVPGTEQTDDLEKLLSVTALTNTLDFLGETPTGIRVNVTGFIPPARGLGSSAAVAGAIARAVARAYGRELNRDELFELVQSVERVAHGTPSGLDAYATTEDGPIWFSNGVARPLRAGVQPRLLIADTGVTGRTSEAVRLVRELYTQQSSKVESLLDEAAGLVEGAGRDLEMGNVHELGVKMNRNHEILRELGVSSEGLETLVTVARDAGALGAKLTGGGMGGCMVALVADEAAEAQVADRLSAAGAKSVWRVHEEVTA